MVDDFGWSPAQEEEGYPWLLGPDVTVCLCAPEASLTLISDCAHALSEMGWRNEGTPGEKCMDGKRGWLGQVPGLGEVGALLYRGEPDIPHLRDARLVELDVPGFWHMMMWNTSEPRYRQEALALSDWIVTYLYRVCGRTDLVYAAIQFDDSVLDPEELLEADYVGRTWSFANTAVSLRYYSEADLAELRSIFRGGYVDIQPAFAYFSATPEYNPLRCGVTLERGDEVAIARVIARPFVNGPRRS